MLIHNHINGPKEFMNLKSKVPLNSSKIFTFQNNKNIIVSSTHITLVCTLL